MTIQKNLNLVEEKIQRACDRVGRSRDSVTLVAVSKTHSAEVVIEAYQAGLRHFGENRVEEAEVKIPRVNTVTTDAQDQVIWHMIGHIQSRKAKQIPPLFDWIHSVDSLKLAKKLDGEVAQESQQKLNILLEINVSGEASKSGFAADRLGNDLEQDREFWTTLGAIHQLSSLQVRGLMTMAPIVDDMEQARSVFTKLFQLREKITQQLGMNWPELSMGMTDDFPVAIEEGATLIRVGRALFGERSTYI